MEQCSSQMTAEYKTSSVVRLRGKEPETRDETARSGNRDGDDIQFIDLTGGFGIDFSYMARAFGHATYVERQPHLCEIARHNFDLLGLNHVDVVCDMAEKFLEEQMEPGLIPSHTAHPVICLLDPARRDDVGRKVAALEDCTPNVIELQDRLLKVASRIILKLSPMLDITQALRQLKNVSEVHVVSVKGECKEVLIVMQGTAKLPSPTPKGESTEDEAQAIRYHCVNLDTEDAPFVCTKVKPANVTILPHPSGLLEESSKPGSPFLFEPNASILKAGVQDYLCEHYDIEKLHPTSNLFVGGQAIPSFPGRQFVIEAIGDFSKSGIKQVLGGIKQANLTIRNFPTTVAELRKRLKLKEGGNVYLFATTLSDGGHALIRCRKTED